MPDPTCIFCKIAAAQVPCYKVLETDRVLAFLDAGPLARGHMLLLPKEHYPTISAMPDDLVAACATLLPRLSRALVSATACPAWNVLQNNGRLAGQSVGHVHFHLIPRAANDALGFRWPAGKLDPVDAKELQAKLQHALTP